MSAIKHAIRFAAGRMYDLRVLLIGGTLALPAIWIVDYLNSGQPVSRPESALIFPAIVGPALFVLWLAVLAFELYRKRLSIWRYGRLSKEEAAEFHAKIAHKWLER